MEQVQMDTTEYTATEKETIQVDQDTGDNLVVEDQLKPPSVIFLDSPNGDSEGPSINPSPQPHTTSEIEKEETQAKPPTVPALTSKATTATTSPYTTTSERQAYMLLPPVTLQERKLR